MSPNSIVDKGCPCLLNKVELKSCPAKGSTVSGGAVRIATGWPKCIDFRS